MITSFEYMSGYCFGVYGYGCDDPASFGSPLAILLILDGIPEHDIKLDT
jgi:hypothetical protein